MQEVVNMARTVVHAQSFERPSPSSSRSTHPASFEPIVFLPGLLCDQSLWRHQVGALADDVAPMIAHRTLDDNIGDMARRTPHRVRRLALFKSSARADTPERIAQRHAGIESLQRGKFLGVTRRLLNSLVHPSHVEGTVADEMRAMAQRVGGDAFLRQQQAIMSRPDSTGLLSTIAVPTMIVVGDGDRITPPAHAEEIHDRVVGSVLHIIRDCGHMAALEHPGETTTLLREWLATEAD